MFKDGRRCGLAIQVPPDHQTTADGGYRDGREGILIARVGSVWCDPRFDPPFGVVALDDGKLGSCSDC